jgi:hypothetical protein
LSKESRGTIPKLLFTLHFDVNNAAFLTATEPTRNTTTVRLMFSKNLLRKGFLLFLRGAICSVRRSVPKINAEMITVRCFILPRLLPPVSLISIL